MSYDGYRIIETGESDYVNNILVYTNNSTSNPKIAKILVIETEEDSIKHNETYLSKVRSTLYGYEQLGYEQSGRSAIENVADAFREVVFSSVSGYRNGAFRKIRRLNEQQTSGGTNGQGVLGDGNGTRERGKGKDHSIDRNVSRRTSDTENRGNEDQVGEKYSSEGNLVVQKNGIDHSLDLSTDTENAEVETEFEGMEDRGWDLPEALENQLIADLESSFVEEDSDGDIYVDGEAKKYAEVSLYAKTKTKGGKVKEKSILETEGRELRDVIRDAFVRGTGNSEQTAYLDEDTAPEDFGDGTITANMTFYGSWDNVKREIGKGTVYFRDKNTGVNIALPVSAMEMENGRTELFAGLRNDDPDYGNFADHSLEQYLGYPSFVRADENFRLYKDNYLPEDTMSDVADYNIERGTRPAGMEEYYPRVSPWVEQSNLDIKNELKDAAAGIVEKWKKDAKLTGGRVLDTKKIKPLVNELVDHCVKLPEYYTASERRACRKIAMDALQNVWYEIQNHENPDLDVIYEILYDAADYIS